ncbi:Gfo/Idh/MocA family protein [Emticicia fluvialis]|uniref:Gfo/Idh/MocA family protein n=1 Tax=Emticicia fluvialis TaxID=2974474 RepID=UPI002165D1BB|nr:Gfo/Idh/MocA family oxidoreductase [Emticicia fluvialis]
MSNKPHRIAMLGTGLIGWFYTKSLHEHRRPDRVQVVYSRSEERGKAFAEEWGIPEYTTSMEDAIKDENINVVVVGLPNDLHFQAIELCCKYKKAVLCTKPLARTGDEARAILEMVEKAGIFHGYLEDLAYTPKTLHALQSVKNGVIGRVTWARSREAHPGPHSSWFWDLKKAGGGAIVDLGCHCIEIARNYIGKDIRPVEVMCWAATQVKPIEAEDNAIALVKYASGAIAQFEVSWSFRGGMDLRDEVSGTEGVIRTDHFMRTGFEMFTAAQESSYVAEKAESASGWLFPVGDEVNSLGYTHMFTDMFDSLDNGGTPMESFYDGYIVNAVIDACYKSAKTKKWEPVEIIDWRGRTDVTEPSPFVDFDADHWHIKDEFLPDGRKKVILKEKATGNIIQRVL